MRQNVNKKKVLCSTINKIVDEQVAKVSYSVNKKLGLK